MLSIIPPEPDCIHLYFSKKATIRSKSIKPLLSRYVAPVRLVYIVSSADTDDCSECLWEAKYSFSVSCEHRNTV